MVERRSNTRTQQEDHDLAFCILWSPLPPITWFLPFIGHMGIADSNGVASDFQGSFYVGERGRMAFGEPTRALRMNVDSLPGGAEQWDEMIREANRIYSGRVHNICCDNCHSHVACALNKMQLRPPFPFVGSNWDMVKLCFLVFFRARFLSLGGFVQQFLPCLLLVALIYLPAHFLSMK